MSQDDLVKLLSIAARDPAVRDGLISGPAVTAQQTIGVQVDDEDVKLIAELAGALLRFGGNASLDRTDADAWSIGILHVKLSQVRLPGDGVPRAITTVRAAAKTNAKKAAKKAVKKK
jgi:hypothetical protein